MIKLSGLSQVEFCRRTGILTQTMTGYLNGGIPRNIQDLESMARELDTTIDWLLTGREPKAAMQQVSESRPVYGGKNYTEDETSVVEEYRQADDKAREIGRMVFRMNPQDKNKTSNRQSEKSPE
ncbi:MAG: helix-turn-helix domain-containing protein [Nitrospiria bacterium]